MAWRTQIKWIEDSILMIKRMNEPNFGPIHFDDGYLMLELILALPTACRTQISDMRIIIMLPARRRFLPVDFDCPLV